MLAESAQKASHRPKRCGLTISLLHPQHPLVILPKVLKNPKFQAPNYKWFDKPFDKLTVLSEVEGLTTLSQVEG